MAIGDLVPWRWGGLRRAQGEQGFDTWRSEMEALHRNLDRVFEDMWNGGFAGAALPDFFGGKDVTPRLDVSEDEKSVHVTAELPGMDEKDVAVTLTDRVLTIRGEKKEEKESKEKDVTRRERVYGSFRRSIEIPTDIDIGKIEAKFRNGVLTIELPRTKEAQQKVKQIPVKAA